MAKNDPTPQERADIVVRQLEQFIRDGKTASGGMNFKAWQDMARKEIADAIISDAKTRIEQISLLKRILLCVSSMLTTIGILGAALTLDRGIERRLGGLILAIAGIALMGFLMEWWGRGVAKTWRAQRRAQVMVKVEELEKKIKRMEDHLFKKAKALEKKMQQEEEPG